ncbi:MAG TPA: MFS transporter, partial [Cytophagaceae bacterium]
LSSTQKIYILITFSISFFIWGFLTVLNFVLINDLKALFDLSYSVSTLINLTFFTTYLLASIPAAKLVKSWGYKLCLISGLFTTGLGCMLFYFAVSAKIYYFFLLALAVQATGITLLQVTANLYVVFFGKQQRAATRLTLMHAFNALGGFLAPLYGEKVVRSFFGLVENVAPVFVVKGFTALEAYVQSPYIILSIFMYLLTIFFVFVEIPEFNTKNWDFLNILEYRGKRIHVMHFKQLRLGAFAVFAYQGAEVALANFLVGFHSDLSVYYWGLSLAGKFIGAWYLIYGTPSKILATCASGACLFLLISIVTIGEFSIWCVALIGLFNSVMFPAIFFLGTRGLGRFSEDGAGSMVMAFVGAAVIPFNVVNFAAAIGYKIAFIYPLVCYGYIIFYALKGSQFVRKPSEVNEDVSV